MIHIDLRASKALILQTQVIHLHQHEENAATNPGPCTVIDKEIALVTSEFLKTTINRFSRVDDVWSRNFLESVIFVGSTMSKLTDDALRLARTYGVKNIYASEGSHKEGPYLLSGESLHEVSRLYPDTAEAFIVSTIQSSNDSQS